MLNNRSIRFVSGLGLLLAAATVTHAAAVNVSFTGTFAQDDEVQLFNFTTDGSSTVYLVSYGYGGGVQADGNVVLPGGFDTILALFDAAGNLIDQNDDGDSSCFSGAEALVPGIDAGNADPHTGATWDTCLSSLLDPGTYTVAVMQYDNFANGPTLADGFTRSGEGNFTATNTECTQGQFCDVSATPVFTNRTNFWAFDVLNVQEASVVEPEPTPEPATLALVGAGFALLGVRRRRTAR